MYPLEGFLASPRALEFHTRGVYAPGMARRRQPEVTIHKSGTTVRVPRKRIRELVAFAARAEATDIAEVEVAVVGPEEIAAHNRRWLRHAGPTDVISFDLSDAGGLGLCVQLIVCGEVARQEGRLRGTGTQRELLLYVLHGLLHQMGYDDQAIRSAARMRARQEEILAAFLTGQSPPRA